MTVCCGADKEVSGVGAAKFDELGESLQRVGAGLGSASEDHLTRWGSFDWADGDEGAGWPDLDVMQSKTRDFGLS